MTSVPDESRAPVPEGWHTVTPRISTADPSGLVTFIQSVFQASGAFEPARPTVLRIGDSAIMIGGSDARGGFPAFLYVYVPDVDGAYARAIAAGAQSIEDPIETPYGDRRATVRDRWGNLWQIAALGRP